jgi:mRNA-degrading endonuclease toxin of MazEF toxin-antitoxin module
MINFDRGDVVIVDLGMVGKVRPGLVLSIRNADSQRNMSIVAPLTTEIRGGECEVAFPKPLWLKSESVVNVLGIGSVDNVKVVRRLAKLPEATLNEVYTALFRAFGVPNALPPTQ